MAKSYLLFLLVSAFLCSTVLWMAAQSGEPEDTVIRKEVDLVQFNVAVTDNKGNYVTGIRPSEIVITEDGIQQKIATFEEGNEAPRRADEMARGDVQPKVIAPEAPHSLIPEVSTENHDLPPGSLVGANVFILFDTSNYMYKGRSFVYAQDAISEFVRSLEGPDRVALYSYNRDLSRPAPLTPDKSKVLHGVRSTVNGDDSALYNSLLLTLKDAGQYSGRKVVVVFSNGPDNASMVAPEDVGELAQSEGIPIYIISTHEARQDPASATAFGRISASTGGEAYFAKDWKDQQQAFSSIRDDLAHLYLVSYYPQSNPNRGWRTITVKLMGERLKKYHVRTRSGYRPLPSRAALDSPPAPTPAE